MKTQETLERMCYQSEDEKKRIYERKKKKNCRKNGSNQEGDHPEAYIYRFEEVMREVPKREWPHLYDHYSLAQLYLLCE